MRLNNNGDQLELTAEVDGSTFPVTQAASAFLGFGSERKAVGIRLAVLSLLSLAGGLAIVSQVHLSSTIGWLLLIDCYIVAAVLLVAAVALGVHAIRNVMGGVVVDNSGLRLHPLFFRNPVTWSKVHEWEAKQIAGLRLLRIFYRGPQRDESLVLSSQWLSEDNLRHIERELRKHVA